MNRLFKYLKRLCKTHKNEPKHLTHKEMIEIVDKIYTIEQAERLDAMEESYKAEQLIHEQHEQRILDNMWCTTCGNYPEFCTCTQ